jgi:phosphoribosyl 1,2-cyclic phosphate phosphodiesterase
MIRLNDFKPLDGVLITHEHYDHVGGLDDLRPFCRFRDVPVYAEQYTAERLRQRIPYCFAEHLYPGVPRITLEEIVPDSPFIIGNPEGNKVEVTPLRVMHGKLPILGYRIGRMAWITDMLTMPGAEYDLLQAHGCGGVWLCRAAHGGIHSLASWQEPFLSVEHSRRQDHS